MDTTTAPAVIATDATLAALESRINIAAAANRLAVIRVNGTQVRIVGGTTRPANIWGTGSLSISTVARNGRTGTMWIKPGATMPTVTIA